MINRERGVTSKLALGAAQFGQKYGIANSGAGPGREDVRDVLRVARANGMDTIDTAQAYGESESWLGEAGMSGWKVVSKLPVELPTSGSIHDWVRSSTLGSAKKLRINCLHGLLVHRSEWLHGAGGDELFEALQGVKQDGLVRKVGVSIYDPEELGDLMDRYPIDLVQAPFNIFDRRMELSGWFSRLKHQHVEVHVRSVFLQGLLLMSRSAIPAKFSRWDAVWNTWFGWIDSSGIPPLAACLGFAMRNTFIDRLVVGVDNANQLRDILLATRHAIPGDFPEFPHLDNRLINPSRWSSL